MQSSKKKKENYNHKKKSLIYQPPESTRVLTEQKNKHIVNLPPTLMRLAYFNIPPQKHVQIFFNVNYAPFYSPSCLKDAELVWLDRPWAMGRYMCLNRARGVCGEYQGNNLSQFIPPKSFSIINPGISASLFVFGQNVPSTATYFLIKCNKKYFFFLNSDYLTENNIVLRATE